MRLPEHTGVTDMKYIDKFPDMEPIFDEREGMIRGGDMKPCIVCGCPTEFIEINYEARLCSEECMAEMDRCANEEFKYYMDCKDTW